MAKLFVWAMLAGAGAVTVSLLGVSMARSDVYPEWSTLRSDAAGTKVLFQAMSRSVPDVRRNFEDLSQAEARRALYVFAGASPLLLSDPKRLQFAADSDSEVLLLFAPPAAKSALRTEKFGFLHARGGFTLRSEAWKCLDGERDACRLARRDRIRILADATPVTNGSLRDARDTALLAKLFSTGLPVVFDESHLGVTETGGTGVLLRKYGLFPAMALLLTVGALYVWRNSTTLAPEREPATAAMAPRPAASLTTLLRQSVPESKLAETIAGEWKRALPLLPVWQAGRQKDLESAAQWAATQKDVGLGYEAMRAALRPRKEQA